MQFKYISAILFLTIAQVSAVPSPDSAPVAIRCHTKADCPTGDLCCGPFNAFAEGHCQNAALLCLN
ncbi:hypothetical protein BDZ94DRAFT_1253936 [Collybia nuda]|uniref:Uncharacterized protein n=1 Tax=Collybia nuda TaxID=64659 RepID=A0A9P5YBP3_9AGAR|nr:hypothetical protein BDZ94DRAFT_1253936 [Collybia nuda]